jgi:hypothetical protein
MSKTPGKTPQSNVIRQFEPSRLGSDNLAAAFEHAVPTIGRVVGTDRTPTIAVVEPRRVVRAVS